MFLIILICLCKLFYFVESQQEMKVCLNCESMHFSPEGKLVWLPPLFKVRDKANTLICKLFDGLSCSVNKYSASEELKFDPQFKN